MPAKFLMTAAPVLRLLVLGGALSVLAACDTPPDWDLRPSGTALNTSDAARAATANRPAPDARGVISYPSYQVAVAERGDTVASLAARVGLPADELARHNGLTADMGLRGGEVLALPRRVSEPFGVQTGTLPGNPVTPGGAIDITTLAGNAIERAGPTPAAPGSNRPQGVPGREPVRHLVLRGETAFTIARLYNVPAKALADWNGLGPDLAVREGQFLMIPVPGEAALEAAGAVSAPGQGSVTPEPPSASTPLPDENPAPAAAAANTPASPDLAGGQTAASAARFAMPADGKIIRAYDKGRNDGIDISAASGSAVRAAADGTVAKVTKDADQVQILIIRHAGNVLTVYANVSDVKVAQGAAVKRGQTVASISSGSPAFVHFEVRQGFDSVDPLTFLQ